MIPGDLEREAEASIRLDGDTQYQHCAWRKESQDQSTLEDCHQPATHGEYCEVHYRMEHHHHDGRGQ